MTLSMRRDLTRTSKIGRLLTTGSYKERSSFQHSGGGYEIRAHDRRVVTTKREDLSNILDHMNIQVDNPIVVLNQETSRNFLQSKSAKDKYVFFLKATQLETVKANYEEAEENARQATSSYDNKNAVSFCSDCCLIFLRYPDRISISH